MSYRALTLIATVILFTKCTDKQQVKAKIFERKQLNRSRLSIKYRYFAGNKTYIDSAIIKNLVIAGDSINVIIDPASPQTSLPDLSK